MDLIQKFKNNIFIKNKEKNNVYMENNKIKSDTEVLKTNVSLDTVKLEPETVLSLQKLNTTMNSLMGEFGQMYVRRRDLEMELQRLNKMLSEKEDMYDKLNVEFSEIFKTLDQKYPNGRIDLAEGTVTFQPKP